MRAHPFVEELKECGRMGAMPPPPPTCRWRGVAGTYLQSHRAFVEECLSWGP